ncbi:Hypothetical predicted protein [Pelobates cultripes]|uniref:Uncharacterized protein n=1 Tax=Pelobates cultripes TaxID=61616 RepID=A0AAD1VSV6_PELCU|nr:Hypothetical predicted protein [Pelobates cultripes]
MLLDRARQVKATQAHDKGDQACTMERPETLPTSRQTSRTTPLTRRRRELRKQRYRLRHRDADRRPARCRKTPSPKAPRPVLSNIPKPMWSPPSLPPCRPRLGNPLPSERAAAWMTNNMLDSPVNPVGIG